MKISQILLPIIAIAILSLAYVGNTNAKGKEPKIEDKPVDAKCYVELVGGSETISLWRVKPSKLRSLIHKVKGAEVFIIPRQSQQKKGTIYKAHECVLEEDDFSSSIARTMDKATPR